MGKTRKSDKSAPSENDFSPESICFSNLTTQEKITKLLFLLNNIDGLPEINKVIDTLRMQKQNVLELYDWISLGIREEVDQKIEAILEYRLLNSKLEKKMDSLVYKIKISPALNWSSRENKGNLHEIPSSDEYRIFLEMYGDNMKNTQEIMKLKSELTILLDSQSLLDRSYAFKMAQIDYQIISLGRVNGALSDSKTREAGELYRDKFNKTDQLLKSIFEGEERFKKIKMKLQLSSEGFIYSKFQKDVGKLLDPI